MFAFLGFLAATIPLPWHLEGALGCYIDHSPSH